MANFIKTYNSFAHGAIAPEFYARDDLGGLACLENMDVLSGGGLTRRNGLAPVAELPGPSRLITFSVNDTDEYLLVLGNGNMIVFHNGQRTDSLTTPWTVSALDKLQYAQRFGTMIFVHPDYTPRILSHTDSGFALREFDFSRNDADMTANMPFMRFDDTDDIKITVSSHTAGNNYATFTASSALWNSNYVGTRLMLMGKQWLITEYITPTQVVAYTNGTYNIPSSPITQWYEAAFSKHRGWPISITFHQDRLVFGGSRSHPSGVWLSRVGMHNNFNVGTGLDDEAIFITLLAHQRQQICTVVSSDNLQILTTTGEWAISNKPLTPSSVDIKQHTTVGSYATRYLPPQKIEGATIFISGNCRDIRELSLDELGENYNATDLCAFSKHLMCGPVDMSYNPDARRLFIVMTDGTIATLNYNSALGISAWGTYKTVGKFISVATLSGKTYTVVYRDGEYKLEYFSSSALRDGGTYDFAYRASGIPFRASGHNAGRIRIRKITARTLNTKSVFINGTRIALPNECLAPESAGFSGDISVNTLGTVRDGIGPIWTVHGNLPEPATILSLTIHGWYTV